MLLADTSGSISAVGAMVAALSATAGLIAAIYYGSKALAEAKATVAEAKAAREAAHTQHMREMAERRHALDAEITLRRIDQARIVLDALIELREVAYNVDQTRDISANSARLPVVGAKLSAALTALEALGGPPLEKLAELSFETEQSTRPAIQIEGAATKGITTMRDLFANHPSLALGLDSRSD